MLKQILLVLLAYTMCISNTRGQASTKGTWGPVLQTEVIPVAAANLPDGKILGWSAKAKNNFGGSEGKTFTTIFDPSNNSFSERLVSNTEHDMFCPGTANLPDGRIMVTGGSASSATTIYDPISNSFFKERALNTPRGYHSMVTLRDGRVFTLGGSWSGGRGNKNAEVWSEQSGWVPYPGITADQTLRQGAPDPRGVFRDDNHGWLWAAPNGKIFQAGPGNQMHWIELDGIGKVSNAGNRGDDTYAMNGNTVMYDKGKILKSGGAATYDTSVPASKRSYIIDIGGNGNSNVTRVGDLVRPRTLHNSVVLPNGEVVTVGGMPKSKLFSDDGAHLSAEIWSPQSMQWREVASMAVPRTYHSVAILMKDGRVWVAGGGLCGTCPVNHPDAQIYTPPYLYDQNNNLANRPAITSAPSTTTYNYFIPVKTNRAISQFSFVRLSSVTHSVNNEQRRIPLEFRKINDQNYQVKIPGRNHLPPGNYFLFAMDANGVPSIAKTIKVGNTNIVQEVMDGTYYIESVASNQRIIAPAWDNYNARMYNVGPWDDHKWRIKHLGGNVYSIQNVMNNRYLEVPYGACSNSSNVGTWIRANEDHNKWIITREGNNFFFRPLHCKSMAIDRNGQLNGNVHLWSFSVGNNNQKFRLTPVSGEGDIVNGTYYIRSFVSGQNVIAPSSNSYSARMRKPLPWKEDQWRFNYIGNGKHTIQNIKTGRYLEVSNGACNYGANVSVWVSKDKANQQWYVDHIGNGYFLRPAHCSNRAMDKGGNYENGNVHIWGYNINNNNQKWELIKVEPGVSPRAEDFTNQLDATPIKGRQTSLEWYINQSKEVERLIVQYAEEGDYDFSDLDEVEASSTLGYTQYSYIHQNPVVGLNFYQIKIEYADGSVDHTPFRSVAFEELTAPITIFPNPAEDELFIDLSNYMDEKIYYFINDTKGTVLTNGVFEKDHLKKVQLRLDKFQNGSYFIYIRPEHHKEVSQQFIIMKKY